VLEIFPNYHEYFFKSFPKLPEKIGPANISETTLLFPKILGNFYLVNIYKKFWKFLQVVLETFHALKMLLGQYSTSQLLSRVTVPLIVVMQENIGKSNILYCENA
jgi:hypothetical protein